MRKTNSTSFKRPYGISYDGNGSKKFQSKNRYQKCKQTSVSTKETPQTLRNGKNKTNGKSSKKINLPEDKQESVNKEQKIEKEDLADRQNHKNSEFDEKQQSQNVQSKLMKKKVLVISSSDIQSSQSQGKRNMLDKKFSNLKNIIRKQKQDHICGCGKKYTSKCYLQLHVKTKHKGQIEKIHQIRNLGLKKEKKIDTNWQQRSIKCLTSSLITQKQLDKEIINLNSKKIAINLQIQGERIFYQMYSSFKTSYTKFPLLYLMYTLKQFFIQNQASYEIWIYDFQNFWLISHIFYNWVCKFSKQKIKNEKYSPFILDSYLLFASWCYHNSYIANLVTKSRILSQ